MKKKTPAAAWGRWSCEHVARNPSSMASNRREEALTDRPCVRPWSETGAQARSTTHRRELRGVGRTLLHLRLRARGRAEEGRSVEFHRIRCTHRRRAAIEARPAQRREICRGGRAAVGHDRRIGHHAHQAVRANATPAAAANGRTFCRIATCWIGRSSRRKRVVLWMVRGGQG
eukprot:scaffold598_cov318-Pavlova_lutheri.AAC.23